MQKKFDTKKQTIAVAMSGGVDSTMAACLLKKQGFNVVGLTMKICPDSEKFGIEDPRPATYQGRGRENNYKISKGCYGFNSLKSIADAKLAAKKLGIPHYVINLEKEYEKFVLNYFRKEYLCGRTPNPCVVCNFKIKFGELLNSALKSGIKFDKFATGHYARIGSKQGRYFIKKGIDRTKDQSYFLYRLSQAQLAKIIFPLGNYKKQEIKALARKLGYKEYAEKQESQNFIESDNYGILFKNKFKPGNIVDISGKILGKHNGIIFYTIGQRRGLDIGGLKEPLYVEKINAKKNEIVVGHKKDLFSKKLVAKDLNWNLPIKIGAKIKCQAKIRFGSPAENCVVKIKNKNTAEVEFTKPQFAITPGQSIVFYQKDILLGGGIIM